MTNSLIIAAFYIMMNGVPVAETPIETTGKVWTETPTCTPDPLPGISLNQGISFPIIFQNPANSQEEIIFSPKEWYRLGQILRRMLDEESGNSKNEVIIRVTPLFRQVGIDLKLADPLYVTGAAR